MIIQKSKEEKRSVPETQIMLVKHVQVSHTEHLPCIPAHLHRRKYLVWAKEQLSG